MNAYDDLMKVMQEGEEVESIVFGAWGWNGFQLPRNINHPPEGVAMSIDDAMPHMEGWSFNGGFGAPDCYAVYIWTNRRVLWVTEYDGSTCLDSAPRNPCDVIPDMPGG